MKIKVYQKNLVTSSIRSEKFRYEKTYGTHVNEDSDPVDMAF